MVFTYSGNLRWAYLVNEYFLAKTNLAASSMQWILPMKKFSRSRYVCENEFSSVIAEFKLECAGLGNKQPRPGHLRKPFCPVCPVRSANNGLHLLFECGSVAALRCETGIQSFLVQCLNKGLSLAQSFTTFVNGLDSHGQPLNQQDYLERGKAMRDMRDLWLTKW